MNLGVRILIALSLLSAVCVPGVAARDRAPPIHERGYIGHTCAVALW